MQGNVMVSAGEARGGREDLQGGSGTGGESRTPGKDRDPRAERVGAATISHLNPPYPQRRPGQAFACKLQLCSSGSLCFGQVARCLGPRAGCARWAMGGGPALAGCASVPVRGRPPGDTRRARSPRPGEDRGAGMPAPASGPRVPEPGTW